MEKAVKSCCEVFRILRAFFPVNQKSDGSNDQKLKTVGGEKMIKEEEMREVSDSQKLKPVNGEKVTKGEEISEEIVTKKKQKSSVVSISKPLPASKSLPSSDKFPRTSLLLSAWQMIEEGYPIPANAEMKEK